MCRSDHLNLYADDITLIVSDKSEIEIEQKCNTIISEIYQWCNQNKLFVNISKTSYMRFHPHQYNPTGGIYVDINIGNTLVNNVSYVKFLGIFMDEFLNWKPHCQDIIRKINSLCYLFRNLKSVLNQHQLITLYHAYVASRLRYGIIFWGNSTLAPQVFIAQKKIIRCIAGLRPFESCRNFFVNAGIMTYYSIYVFELSLHVHQNKHHLTTSKDLHEYNTRNKNDFVIPQSKLKVSHKSPQLIGLKIYNQLPNNFKILNVSQFKQQLRSFLIDKCYYTLNELL